MNDQEYLVSYGQSGEFGRFRPLETLPLERGTRVVVRTPQGLELGTVMCQATPGHARFLSRTALGELLRSASEDDERTVAQVRDRAHLIFQECRHLVAGLQLPMEIIDVEVLLDGTQAIIHHLRREDCDYRSLVSSLSRKFDILVIMHNLALPTVPAEENAEGGCGKPGCGQEGGGGGCSSCGSGGGCGTCGKATKKEDVTAYLAGLRRQMEERGARTTLI